LSSDGDREAAIPRPVLSSLSPSTPADHAVESREDPAATRNYLVSEAVIYPFIELPVSAGRRTLTSDDFVSADKREGAFVYVDSARREMKSCKIVRYDCEPCVNYYAPLLSALASRSHCLIFARAITDLSLA